MVVLFFSVALHHLLIQVITAHQHTNLIILMQAW